MPLSLTSLCIHLFGFIGASHDWRDLQRDSPQKSDRYLISNTGILNTRILKVEALGIVN